MLLSLLCVELPSVAVCWFAVRGIVSLIGLLRCALCWIVCICFDVHCSILFCCVPFLFCFFVLDYIAAFVVAVLWFASRLRRIVVDLL